MIQSRIMPRKYKMIYKSARKKKKRALIMINSLQLNEVEFIILQGAKLMCKNFKYRKNIYDCTIAIHALFYSELFYSKLAIFYQNYRTIMYAFFLRNLKFILGIEWTFLLILIDEFFIRN